MNKIVNTLKQKIIPVTKKKSRIYRVRKKQAGLPPGTLVHTGIKKIDTVLIDITEYSEEKFDEKKIENIEDTFRLRDSDLTSWINICGLHDTSVLEKVGGHFKIHSLVLEDVLNTDQRPKLDDYETFLYCVLKSIEFDETAGEITSEQVSFVLGKKWLITFQERMPDCFEPIRDRLIKSKGRIRKSGVDYLMYALIDLVVDNYFSVLEKIGDSIQTIEDELIGDPQPGNLNTIYKIRRELLFLRKSVYPLREVLNSILRDDFDLIADETDIFVRDVYDHVVQVMDTIETYREMISGMLDTYLSSVSNRMNEVMKVLTIIATIFIPLTFVAGVYGMNFDNFPELHMRWFYPWGFWSAIFILGVVMFWFFKRKKWI